MKNMQLRQKGQGANGTQTEGEGLSDLHEVAPYTHFLKITMITF